MSRARYGLLLMVGLSGCAGQDPLADLRQFVAQGPDKGSKIEALPKPPLPEVVAYIGREHRNPFTSFDEARRSAQTQNTGSGPRPDSDRVREMLEGFDLPSLALVGIVHDNKSQPWAVIKAPDGATYRITLGNHLGRNEGKVVEIIDVPGEKALRINELVSTLDGSFERREQRLEMAP